MNTLTARRARALLSYNRKTGILRWKISNSNRAQVGAVAGCLTRYGYITLGIDGKLYQAHRVAWLIVHGSWPKGELDHEDTVKHHNWIKNLRPATRPQNNINRTPPKNNTSGFKGVGFHKQAGKWRAFITVDGKQRALGLFATREAAASARRTAEIKAFGAFARAA
jgi:hypothetical protein